MRRRDRRYSRDSDIRRDSQEFHGPVLMQERSRYLNVGAAAVWATDATAGQAVGAALELRDLVSSGGLCVPAAVALAMGARHIALTKRGSTEAPSPNSQSSIDGCCIALVQNDCVRIGLQLDFDVPQEMVGVIAGVALRIASSFLEARDLQFARPILLRSESNRGSERRGSDSGLTFSVSR